jgi:tetratricopeptide (TPR) repeat protein
VQTDPSLFKRAQQAYIERAYDAALPLADAAIVEDPLSSQATHLRGLISLALNAPQEAQAWLERAVELLPHPTHCNSLCVCFMQLQDFASAAEAARLGVLMGAEHFPGFKEMTPLRYNLGLSEQLLGQFEAAVATYRNALEFEKDHAATHNNLGAALKNIGDLESAIVHLREAIKLNPNNLEAHSNLGHFLLALGRFDEAWPYFEHRWASFQVGDRSLGLRAPELPVPLWRGETLPADATLIALHEQGLGDALQFCRYLPMALERFARVAYVCPPPLRRLLEQSMCTRWPNLVLLDGESVDISAWTHYSPLLSLPMCFGTRLDNIPASVPYLHADPLRTRAFAERLGADPRPKIGLVWAGGHTGMRDDTVRSIAPASLGPLLSYRGAQWVSLQKAEVADKRLPAEFAGQIIDWMDEVTDFADTAALIGALDLVIAVDTSVAHLAAAMGKPVWLLNRFAGCWRWLRDRDDSPWYPGLRLFTQPKRGDWNSVLMRVRSELEALSV